jgi:endogenous inhibitor of DNA gyrase (YacG/DUF329 family)
MFTAINAIRRVWGSSQSVREDEEKKEENHGYTSKSTLPSEPHAIEGASRERVGADGVSEIQMSKEKKKRIRKRKSSGVGNIPEEKFLERENLPLQPQGGIDRAGNSLEGNGEGEQPEDAPIEPKKPKRQRASKKKESEKQSDNSIPAKPKRQRKSRAKNVVEAHPELPPDLDNPDSGGNSARQTTLQEVDEHSMDVQPGNSSKLAQQHIAVVVAARRPEDIEGIENEEYPSEGASKRKRKIKLKPWLSEAKVINSYQEHEPENEHTRTPIRASAKALGKRKASDMRPETVSKPKRARKSKDNSRMSLFDLGFTKESSGSQMAVEDLIQTAKDLYLESTMKISETSPILPPGLKSKRKSKAKAPIMLAESAPIITSTSGKRRARPESTPVNTQSARKSSPHPHDDPVQVSGTGVDEAAGSSTQKPSSAPKSNKKRKRRNKVDSEEKEGESIQPDAAVITPAIEKKGLQPPNTPNESTKNGPVRKGKLASQELDAIDTAVQNYMHLRNLTQFSMNELIQGSNSSAETREFWQAVQKSVPDVPHRKLYDTCRRRFHNFESRGSWTKEQDEELKDAYAHFPQKWKQIGEVINRFPEDARDRWRNYLVCGDSLRKDYWDKEEEDKLRGVLAKYAENLRKDQRIAQRSNMSRDDLEAYVDWQVVSQLMDGARSQLQCRTKWKSMKEREDSAEEDVEAITKSEWRAEEATRQAQAMTGDEILQLLVAIRDSGAGKESKIPWLLITEAIQKIGKRMALRICFRKLRKRVPGTRTMRFKEIVDTLITEFEESLPDIPDRYVDTEYIRPAKRKSSSQVPSNPRSAFGTPAEGSRKIQRRTMWGTQYGQKGGSVSSKGSRGPASEASGELSEELSEGEQEENDHGERRSRNKSKSQPTGEPLVGEELKEQDGPAVPIPARKSRQKSKPQPIIAADEGDKQPRTPKPTKRKKLRESMKKQDESQSQSQDAGGESEIGQDAEDITEIFQSLKKKVPKLRKGKAKALEDVLRDEIADPKNRDSTSLGDDNQDGNQSASQFSEESQPAENNTTRGITEVDDPATAETADEEPENNGPHHRPGADFDDFDYDDDDDDIVNDIDPVDEDSSTHPSSIKDIASENSDDNDDGQSKSSQGLGSNGHTSSPSLAIEEAINEAPSQQGQSQEELDHAHQTEVVNDEMELMPDNKGSNANHNAPSSESSSNEEGNQTPDRAESVDLDTLTPVTKKYKTITQKDSRSRSHSPSSDAVDDPDSDSSSDEASEHAQRDEEQARTVDHEISQFGEEEETSPDHDMDANSEIGGGETRQFGEEEETNPDHDMESESEIGGGEIAESPQQSIDHATQRTPALKNGKTRHNGFGENEGPAHSSRVRGIRSSGNCKKRSEGYNQSPGSVYSSHVRLSVSPDLDTLVKNDGRRSFRACAKPINYDDTAHLNADADSGDSESSNQQPHPRVKRQTKSRISNGKAAEKAVEPAFNSSERSGSVSSSDYSIPAEATPKHMRAERLYDESVDEEPEKIGWEASDLPKPKKKKTKSAAGGRGV